MITHDLIKKIKNGMYDETLKDVYVDEKKYRMKESVILRR